jgi:hypothetical protein
MYSLKTERRLMKKLFIGLAISLFSGILLTRVGAQVTPIVTPSAAQTPLMTTTPSIHHHHHKNPMVMTSAATASGMTAVPPSPYAAPGITPTLNPSAVYGFTATGAPFKESPTMP